MRRIFSGRAAVLALSVGIAVAPFTMSTASAAPGNHITVSGTASASVAAVGGSGGFTFSPTACAYVGTSGAGTCTVAVTGGTFTNIVCGTGSAAGHVKVTDGAKVIAEADFTITFAGGAGVFVATNEAGHGVVQIAPVAPATPPGCVTQFQVTASVVVGA